MKRNWMIRAKRISALLLGTVLLGSLATGCGGSSSSDNDSAAEGGTTTIQMATGGQDTLPSYATVLDGIDDIQENTDIEFSYFGSRQLGDDAEIVQQVMAGTIQMGGTAASALSTYTDLLDAFTVPFLLDTYEKEREAMVSEEAQAIFDAVEEELGLKIFVAYDSGMRYFANNIRPIETLDDVKGLVLRVAPADILLDSFSAMGINPSTLAYGELYTGLQNGTIDGEEINITSIYSEKHYEVLKYFTDMGIYPFATVIFANADWFNSLPADEQEAIQSAFTNGYNYLFAQHLPEAEAAGLQAMEDAGIEISSVQNPQEFRDAVADVVETYRNRDDLTKAFIEMAEGL